MQIHLLCTQYLILFYQQGQHRVTESMWPHDHSLLTLSVCEGAVRGALRF